MAKKPLFIIDPDSEVKATGAGYVYVTTTPDHPGKKMKDHDKTYVYKHIALKELELGRFLRPDEHVDHINEDQSNNAPSNLKLMDKRTHPRKHMKKNKVWKHSPMNKPGRKACINVISNYLNQLLDNQ